MLPSELKFVKKATIIETGHRVLERDIASFMGGPSTEPSPAVLAGPRQKTGRETRYFLTLCLFGD